MIPIQIPTLLLAASLSLPALAQSAPLQKPTNPAVPIQDDTDAVLKRATPNGSVRLGSVKMKERGVSITLHLEQDAQDLIAREGFDVEDAGFDQDKFRDYVFEKFGNGLSFLVSRVPDWPPGELHVLITDMGEDRHRLPTFFIRGARVVVLDIRVWENIYRQKLVFSETMPVHELTHFLQGFSAPKEPAYHSELAACVVEIVYLRHRIGAVEKVFVDYPRLSGPLQRPQDVTDPERLADPEKFDYTVLRHLAHKLVTNILRGTYKFAPAKSLKATGNSVDDAKIKDAALVANLERFAIRYARHPQIASAGFDATCREFGLRDVKNQLLTLDTLRRDLARDLPVPLSSSK